MLSLRDNRVVTGFPKSFPFAKSNCARRERTFSAFVTLYL